MGRHHSATGNRKVSRGFVVAVVGLLIVVAAVAGWLALRDHASDEGRAAADACISGDESLLVAVTPSMVPSIRALAQDYADTDPVVRDHCIRVNVQSATRAQVVAAVSGNTGPGDTGSLPSAPALWIAESTVELDGLRNAAPERIDGVPVPIAASPVVLATTASHAQELTDMAWSALPSLQRDAGLGLAMPTGGDHAATMLALAATIANAQPDPTGHALSADSVKSQEGAAAAQDLVDFAPGDPAATPHGVLAALAAGTASDGVRLLPTTAQTVQQAQEGAGPALAAVHPTGATPVLDYPAVALDPTKDTDIDGRTLSAAASEFLNFLAAPDQQTALAEAGFLVSDPAVQSTAEGPSTARPDTILPGPSAEAVAALTAALDTRVDDASRAQGSSTTTLLLDISGSMSATEGGSTRLSNAARELAARIDALPATAAVGLWTYSANPAGSNPYRVIVSTGELGDDVGGGTTRRQALANGLDSASPESATHTYRSLVGAYAAAVDGYRPGQRNSVLLITDGPNDDQTFLSTQRLLDALADAGSPDRPVAVDVIVIGPNEDLASLQDVADATGGTLKAVPSSAEPAFAQALQQLLG